MAFIWIIILYLMADVMGRGHGGDGREDPPPPFGGGRGQHQLDAVPPRKKRGRGKNLGLPIALEKNGKAPLPLVFDREATFIPVGKTNDYLVREMGIHIWNSIPLDRKSWKVTTDAEKNGMMQHLRSRFDFDAIARDTQERDLMAGIKDKLQKRYSDRKGDAKRHFIEVGGYDNIDRSRANPPEGMLNEFWQRTVTHFCSEEYKKLSARNKVARGKQKYANHGGTSSYSNTFFKESVSRVDVFFKTHTNKKGEFVSPAAKEKYQALVQELEEQTQAFEQTQTSSNQTTSESSTSLPPTTNPAQVNPIVVFENVMGSRRGYVRGIGRKASSTTSSSYEAQSQTTQPEVTQYSQPMDPVQSLQAILRDPAASQLLAEWIRTLPPQDDIRGNNAGNYDDDASH